MKSESIKCEFCKTEIESEPCKLAVYNTAIEGKDYVFCCAKCAEISRRKLKNK